MIQYSASDPCRMGRKHLLLLLRCPTEGGSGVRLGGSGVILGGSGVRLGEVGLDLRKLDKD